MIFSEKEANWLKFSPQLNVGDIFEAMVGSVEDYGAFIHLRFPDGMCSLISLISICNAAVLLMFILVFNHDRFVPSHWVSACFRSVVGFSAGCERCPS